MELTQENKDLIVFTSQLRGGIVCHSSTNRKCGYEIRVELKINKHTSATVRVLDSVGLQKKNRYTQSDDIDLIFSLIEGLEDLSPTSYGLKMARRLNGKLKQPETHEEVIAALSLIETHTRVRG